MFAVLVVVQQSEAIKYSMGAITGEGALVYDESISGKRPAVLLRQGMVAHVGEVEEVLRVYKGAS